jgi:hypothetical protein
MKKFHDLNFAVHEIDLYHRLFGELIPLNFLQERLEGREIGGGITDFPPLLLLLTQFEFIESLNKKEMVCLELSPSGKDFLRKGRPLDYDLSQNQINLITPLYLQTRHYTTRLWFKNLQFHDPDYQCSRDEIPHSLQQMTEDLLFLGVARQEGNSVVLNRDYLWGVALYRSSLTVEELHQQLSRQEQYGDRATEVALKFERKRLQLQGFDQLARGVHRLDKEHVDAGYDLLSYTSPSAWHNRFIEVKYLGKHETFYLSMNEIRMAKLLKDQYFLYLVNDLEREDSVIVLQDPIRRNKEYHLEFKPVQFEVKMG